MPSFGRRTTYKATWRKARTTGYPRTRAGYRDAFRDMVDSFPALRGILGMAAGKPISKSLPRHTRG